MASVPLNASCSNMWARPVLPMGSWTEPTSTFVKKEKTGALSGRWQTTAVSPLGNFLTVTRFSNDARFWAKQVAARATTRAKNFRARDIEPPRERNCGATVIDVKDDL